MKLRQQFFLRVLDTGIMLIDENQQVIEDLKHAPLLLRLVDGVDSKTLTDDEFDQIQYFSDRGYLSIVDDPDAAAWDLSGIAFSSVLEQLKHFSFSVVDLTKNGVGTDVKELLIKSGMQESSTPSMTFVFADSYLDVPKLDGTYLPIICNRMKIWMGPIHFPWSENIQDKTAENQSYMTELRYSLPFLFDHHQRSWIAISLIKIIAQTQLRVVSSFYELNMTTMTTKIWPL